jgi:hypothetical protein
MERTRVPPSTEYAIHGRPSCHLVLEERNKYLGTVSAVLGASWHCRFAQCPMPIHLPFTLHDHLRFKPFRKCIRLGGRWQTVFSSPKSLTTEANLAVWAVNSLSSSCSLVRTLLALRFNALSHFLSAMILRKPSCFCCPRTEFATRQ